MRDALEVALLLLATAVVVVVVCRLLRLPALIGYLVVGILIGPHALGWVPDTEDTRYLAEFGVVFLMFSIGLEFSLPKLVTMRRLVFGLGAAEVVGVTALVLGLALALGQGWQAGVVLGGALAMSSTAILGKMLADRLELNSLHGRQIIGVALFQDLAVVPFLILIPALAAGAGQLATSLGLALAKAAVVLALILFLGQHVMRPWFHVVARRKSPELFMLNLLLFTLGLAWLTRQLDLSLALGAFLAGMLISETEYRYQVEQDIRPFQDVLLGLFFVTIGMELDLREVWSQWAWVLLLLAALIVFKSALIMGLSRLFGSDSGTAIRTGLALGAGGEFGLVLLFEAGQARLLAPEVQQVVLAALILSMLASPFIIERSEHMVRRFSAADWMYRAMALHTIAAQTMAAEAHASRPRVAARHAGGGAHAGRHRHRRTEAGRCGRGGPRDHGGQPHACLPCADAGRGALQPRAPPHPPDTRAALWAVPGLFPRRHRRDWGRARQDSAAVALRPYYTGCPCRRAQLARA